MRPAPGQWYTRRTTGSARRRSVIMLSFAHTRPPRWLEMRFTRASALSGMPCQVSRGPWPVDGVGEAHWERRPVPLPPGTLGQHAAMMT